MLCHPDMHPAAFQRAFDGRFLDLLFRLLSIPTRQRQFTRRQKGTHGGRRGSALPLLLLAIAYFLLAVVIRLGLDLRSLLLPIRHLLVLVLVLSRFLLLYLLFDLFWLLLVRVRLDFV